MKHSPPKYDTSYNHSDKPPASLNPARIYKIPAQIKYLDSRALAKLEEVFKNWVDDSPRNDVVASRARVFLIFQIIRQTGARLNEVLALQLDRDVHVENGIIRFRRTGHELEIPHREVHVSADLITEIQRFRSQNSFPSLDIDPAHVRRKFYERALACGLNKELGSPNVIRKSRAIELLLNNVPLPVVQRILGHSSPQLTAAFIGFSEDDIKLLSRHFIQKESSRMSSARNSFYGTIQGIMKGDIQSQIKIVTVAGDEIVSVITNNSLEKLGLKIGTPLTAEIKAPWVIIQKTENVFHSSADNIFKGKLVRKNSGKIITEFIIITETGSEICSVLTEESHRKLSIEIGEEVWVLFSSFSVVLHVD